MKRILLAVSLALIGALGAYLLLYQRDNADADAEIVEVSGPKGPSAEAAVTASPDAGKSLKKKSQTFENSTDFALLLVQAIPEAESGDANAANLVAKILDHCHLFSVSGPKFEDAIAYQAKQNPQASMTIHQAALRISNRCRLVFGGESISAEQVETWTLRAAQLGSVEARARHAVRHPGELTPGLKGLVAHDVLLSGDPAAIFEAADLVSSLSASEVPAEIAGLVGGEVNMYAWKVAACRMGGACQQGTPNMDASCITGGPCNYATFENAVRNAAVPAASWDALESRVSKILKIVLG